MSGTCGSKTSRMGVYPYLVDPIQNFAKYILYFDVYQPPCAAPRLPCTYACGSCMGVSARQRAWLVPPQSAGDVVTIQLETTDMNLGRVSSCCCSAAPLRGTIETFVAGLGNPIPQASPVVFSVSSNGATFTIGCTEDAEGRLTYAATDCSAGPATESWLVLSNDGPCGRPGATLYPSIDSSVITTGRACSVSSQTSNRQLLGVPVPGNSSQLQLMWAPDSFAEAVSTDPCACAPALVGLTLVSEGCSDASCTQRAPKRHCCAPGGVRVTGGTALPPFGTRRSGCGGCGSGCA